jgi:molybdate transport system substrate-binding protein
MWAAMLLLVAACGSNTTDSVLVSAASSLTDAFADIEQAFEAENPGVDILLNVAGSSLLREQILGGAPVDVFASANPAVMQTVVEAGLADGPTTFTGNRLQIGVPAGNPAGVVGIEDFADEKLLIGLCAPAVPCGSLAREILIDAGIEPAIDTSEPDVRSLLTKLEAGELDAGIVYLTDVLASDEVTGIEISDTLERVAEYLIAVVADAPNPTAAADFVAFVLSAEGQQILATHGFTAP